MEVPDSLNRQSEVGGATILRIFNEQNQAIDFIFNANIVLLDEGESANYLVEYFVHRD